MRLIDDRMPHRKHHLLDWLFIVLIAVSLATLGVLAVVVSFPLFR